RNREILSLYVIEEPQVTIYKSLNKIRVPLLKEIKVRYSDKRRDAEAIFVDPTDHQLYITSKRDFESTVFSLPLDLNGSTAHTLRPLLTLPFTFTTSADISGDRKYIVAKNLTTIYMWERQNGQSVIETMSQTPQIIPYIIEHKGKPFVLIYIIAFYIQFLIVHLVWIPIFTNTNFNIMKNLYFFAFIVALIFG